VLEAHHWVWMTEKCLAKERLLPRSWVYCIPGNATGYKCPTLSAILSPISKNMCNFEARHPHCVNHITKNMVYMQSKHNCL